MNKEFPEPVRDAVYWLNASGRSFVADAVKQAFEDSARLDFLAEITNLSALRDAGAMLSGEQGRRIDNTVKALSSGYEIHRRTKDTPEAFRLAVDDARRERP